MTNLQPCGASWNRRSIWPFSLEQAEGRPVHGSRELRTGPREDPLVYLFESIDTVLAGVVLLQVGLGLWELCVGDLVLPESLATHTFDELEAKVAGTLVLVLVVRFLEELVQDPEPQQLLGRHRGHSRPRAPSSSSGAGATDRRPPPFQLELSR